MRLAEKIRGSLQLGKNFLSWWVRELTGMVPISIRRWKERHRRRLLLLPEQDGHRIYYQYGDHRREVMLAGPNSAAPLLQKIQDEAANTDDIVLLLPAEVVLRRIVELPQLDQTTLAQLIPNELDRFSPFKVEEVWFDWRRLPGISDNDRMRVEIAVIAADRAKTAVDLTSRLGVLPNRVGIQGDDEEYQFNLIRWHHKARASVSLQHWVGLIALAICIALAVATISAWSIREDETLLALRQAVTSLRPVAEAGDRQRRELTALRERAALLEALQNRRLLIADIAALTRALPDDAWLHALQFTNGRLQIGGQARDAADLIQRIETQDGLRNAQFRQPVTKAGNSGLDRFEIGLERLDKVAR